MKRVAAKFILWLLSQEQKEFCAEVAVNVLQNANSDPRFLKQVIIENGLRIHGYDPETQYKSSQWKSPSSPHVKKVRQS